MRTTGPKCFAAILVFGAFGTACSESQPPRTESPDGFSAQTDEAETSVAADTADGAAGGYAVEPDAHTTAEDSSPDGTTSVVGTGGGPGNAPEAAAGQGGSSPPSVDATADPSSMDAGAYEDAAAFVLSQDAAPLDGNTGEDGAAADGGDGGDSEDGGDGGIPACKPIDCGSHAWACWPMPNSPGSGLPNSANYTDMGDGTVRDNRTCLIWEKRITSNSRSYTYEEAKQRCANPSYPGTGWRVPTRIELMSIADYSRISPSTDKDAFPSVPYDNFWTLSTVPGTATAWTVRFYEGLLQPRSQTSAYYARCVRTDTDAGAPSAPTPAHYDPPANGEVIDRFTKLVWQEKDSQPQSPMAFDAANNYCRGLNLNGRKWRLPSIKELATLVNDASPTNQSAPVVEMSVFGTMAPAPYWSSSGFSGQPPSYPWTLSFADGAIGYNQATAHAKCVQDAR